MNWEICSSATLDSQGDWEGSTVEPGVGGLFTGSGADLGCNEDGGPARAITLSDRKGKEGWIYLSQITQL